MLPIAERRRIAALCPFLHMSLTSPPGILYTLPSKARSLISPNIFFSRRISPSSLPLLLTLLRTELPQNLCQVRLPSPLTMVLGLILRILLLLLLCAPASILLRCLLLLLTRPERRIHIRTCWELLRARRLLLRLLRVLLLVLPVLLLRRRLLILSG